MVRPAVRRNASFPCLSAARARGAWLAFVASSALVTSGALAGCGDLKSAQPAGDAGASREDEGASSDGGSSLPKEEPGTSGPGLYGALPSGYCCTDNSECRDRHCMETASGKMCLDDCREQGTCRRRDVIFLCDAKNLGDDGLCQPPLGFACIPSAQFRRGTRQVGECCAWTGDGNSGEECEGNKCVSISKNDQDNPFVCSHWCERTADCPSGTLCSPYNTCVPANMPYTCK